MKKNMNENFEKLKERVIDTLNITDLDYIRRKLKQIKEPTIVTGVGGSSVVSCFTSKALNEKNVVITTNNEPRDILYMKNNGYKNIIACSYSGNNYGVDLSFNNELKKYLLSNNLSTNGEITNLTYNRTLDSEKSFISLATTLMPISVIMNYYLEGDNKLILDLIEEKNFDLNIDSDIYEIFTGYDTKTASTYLESTLVEAGIGIPIIHDKYSYCHGRSTTCTKHKSNAIYFNRNTEFDKLMLEELNKYYNSIIVIESKFKDQVLDDYQMLIQVMYLTKSLAEKLNQDLSGVDYSPIVKKIYKYNKQI